MTVQINLSEPGWKDRANGKIKQRGTCWQGLEQLQQASTYDDISKILKQQNGFYALSWEQGSKLYAAVDHIRSIPLFYGLKDDEFFLSDNAEWVREQVSNTAMDELAKEEFQLTGYVTGEDTLYPDVKQLQAGEFLSVNKLNEKLVVITERYYRFLHTEPDHFDEKALYQQLDASALASIDNLIRYANGRQIVIPLSGGYDSRLIATLLKRRGYENILTFTYGIPGNKESAYSKKVADALGLKWHFVEYSNELWREVWQTEERWQYQKWASGWSSIAHVQDWLAVKILKKKSIVEDGCIFVPGHTGDFLSGGHVPDNAVKDKKSSSRELTESINKKHYSQAPRDKVTKRTEQEWAERILKRAEQAAIANGQDLANAFEKWEWQERQAKFICNSVRVYEFFNYDWWMPLWDMEFVRFWQSTPLELRKGRRWYIEYVSDTYNKFSECAKIDLGNAGESKKARLLQIISSRWVLRKLSKLLFYSYRRDVHPLAFYGRHDDRHSLRLIKKGYSIVGLNGYLFLKKSAEHKG